MRMSDGIDRLATSVMENEQNMVPDVHRLAGNCAKTAALETLDQRTRSIYRFEEGKVLLDAVFRTHPTLSTETMLRVAARVAERSKAGDA